MKRKKEGIAHLDILGILDPRHPDIFAIFAIFVFVLRITFSAAQGLEHPFDQTVRGTSNQVIMS
eukprot:scaffold16153_cov79-Skeletonema_dohrnii-CCMP3373.AAC.1